MVGDGVFVMEVVLGGSNVKTTKVKCVGVVTIAIPTADAMLVTPHTSNNTIITGS